MSLLSSANPSSRRDYTKLLKRTARIELNGDFKDINLRKSALQLLQEILQGFEGEQDLLVPGLVDQVSALLIQFRHKQCLDCMVGGPGRGDPSEVRPCAICQEPLCGPCLEGIEKVTAALEDEEVRNTHGKGLVLLVCSYCREFGTQRVSKGLLDDIQDTT